MYRPPAFREDRPEVLHAAIRSYPLATLVTHGPSGLIANLIPFTLALRDDGLAILKAHLAKANQQLGDMRAGAEALVIFRGADAYITPNWYPSKQQHGKVVPTWNYVTVQAWGQPRVVDDPDWLLTQIGELTTQLEQAQPKPWAVRDAPADFVNAQLKGIAGVEIPVRRMEGKWKLSQNQSDENRAGVLAGLRLGNPQSTMAEMIETAKAG